MSPRRSSLLCAVALAAGCGEVEYRYGDLELDIAGPVPAEAESVRICLDGYGAITQGAGNGRLAVTGLAVDRTYTAFLNILDESGAQIASAGPAELTADTPVTSTALLDPDTALCTADGRAAPQDASSWVFVVRFDETDTPLDFP